MDDISVRVLQGLILLSVGIGIATIALDYHSRQKRIPTGIKRLPGPKGVPILGAVPQLPTKNIYLKLYEWRREYGPIYQVNLMGTNYVWLSSHKIADDLLAKRSIVYSGRPRLATGEDNRTSMHYMPLMAYNDDYHRGINFIRNLTQSTKERLKHISTQESRTMIEQLLRRPSEFKQHAEHCCARISSRMAWNDGSEATVDETLLRANDLLYRVSPDGEITNKLPILRQIPAWVPDVLQPWRLAEKKRERRERDFWLGRSAKVRDQELLGPSWMQKTLAAKDVQMSDTEIAYSVGMTALIGGVLVSSPLQSFFLAMCLYPEWQTKAQEELDRVCGDRAPTFDDLQNCPIVRAIIRETFRWRPPLPMGVPHVSDRDDVYEGYYIPEGSVVFSLEWALNRDSSIYPEADNFKPERWLEPKYPTYKEPLAYYPSLKGHSGFGWGRRACPGQDHSEIVHFTVISMILWSCQICTKKDLVTGKEILPPSLDYTSYIIIRPNWWEFDVNARDEKKFSVISSVI